MSEEVNKNAPWINRNSDNYGEVPYYFPSLEYSNTYLDEMQYALDNKQNYVFTRIGDGEVVFLNQNKIFSLEYITTNTPWGSSNFYCGSRVPNLELQSRLIEAYNNSNLFGTFKGDPVIEKALEACKIQPKSICYAFDNLCLPMNSKFVNMLLGRKLYIVGKDSLKYIEYLKDKIGANVVGYSLISDYSEIERVKKEMMQVEFEIALVCAGVNAKVICYEMSLLKPSLYIDFGHALDNASHPKGKYDEYWFIPIWKCNKTFGYEEQVLHNKILYKCINQNYIGSELSPEQDKDNWIVLEIIN